MTANTFSFKFIPYTDEEKILIALNMNFSFKILNEKFNLLEDILEVYKKVVKKYKFNTRFREIN